MMLAVTKIWCKTLEIKIKLTYLAETKPAEIIGKLTELQKRLCRKIHS
jgi:hypothetical protein